jgi:hypothetical protein
VLRMPALQTQDEDAYNTKTRLHVCCRTEIDEAPFEYSKWNVVEPSELQCGRGKLTQLSNVRLYKFAFAASYCTIELSCF